MRILFVLILLSLKALSSQSLDSKKAMAVLGLRENDILVAVDGQAMNSEKAAEYLENRAKYAKVVTLTILRDGKKIIYRYRVK